MNAKKLAAFGFLLFLALWLAGIIVAWDAPAAGADAQAAPSYDSSRLSFANNLKQMGVAEKSLPFLLDQPDAERIQVFQKHARLTATSAAFAEDENKIRAALAAGQAVILDEDKAGIAPQRRLTLAVGIAPEKFDVLVEQLRKIGHLESISIQQQDRTGDFRRLNAQRQSLQKHLESVLKLRADKAAIDDALKLEQKIQDIEKELHGLGVQLGDFLNRESFYHAYITLTEQQSAAGTATMQRRLAMGFVWALGWWIGIVAAGGVLAATALSIQTLLPNGPQLLPKAR